MFYLLENCMHAIVWDKTCPQPTTTSSSTSTPRPTISSTTSTTSFSTSLSTSTTQPDVNYRLPKSLVPFHYHLTIKPYFKPEIEPEYYDGTVVIQFSCVNNTSVFVAHMKDIDIYNSSLKIESHHDSSFNELNNIRYQYDSVTQFLIINLENQMFKKGFAYKFIAQFKGYTKNDNAGFYKSSYIDSKNQKKFYSFYYFKISYLV